MIGLVRELLWVAAGGCAGALARHGATRLATYAYRGGGMPFLPPATLAVNLVGCFLIGLLTGLTDHGSPQAQTVRLFLVTGFLGAFTTFSTFGLETVNLARLDGLLPAAANIGAHVLIGLFAVWLGSTVSS